MSSPDEPKQPLSLSDVPRDDLEALVMDLVKDGAISAEEVSGMLEQVRERTGKKLKAASTVELTPEQAELLENLEKQYPKMQATLEKYEVPTAGMPTLEQVKRGLTPEVLGSALKLAEPTLLLVPPTSRQSKVEAINKHPSQWQKYNIYAYELQNNDLWNGGKSQPENKWRVSIVDCVQDVQQDKEINNGNRTNYDMSKLWVKKYEDQGLNVINDADTYLTLVMRGLAEDKPVDPETYTILNGKNLTISSLIARGSLFTGKGQIALDYADPRDMYIPSCLQLRLRGSVEVDVQS